MGGMRRVLGALLLTVGLPGLPGLAAPTLARAACPSQIALASPASTNYAERTGDTRCEGMVVSPVAGGELELVSLTRNALAGPLRQGLAAKAALRVSVQPTGDRPVTLRGVGVPIGLYYRLDAELLPARHFAMTWPLDVVIGTHIASNQIGLVAFTTGADGTPTYLPVDVALPPAAGPAAAAPLVAVLRTDAPIENVQWCFAPPACSFRDLAATDGEAFAITIDNGAKPGVLQVRWTSAATGRRHAASFAVAP